jgi:SRSO17 transposase
LLQCLPDEAWEAVTWREGTKAPLTKQFVAVRVHRATGNPDDGGAGRSTTHARVTTGPEGWLLAERPLPGERGEAKWSFLWLPGGPVQTPLLRLVTLAHARWPIEQTYEDPKGECGLDDFQGRRWDGLHRHLALVWLAYRFLVLHRLAAIPLAPGVPPLDDWTC